MAPNGQAAPGARTSKAQAREAYGKLPLAFVRTAGQSDARVRYSAQTSGASFAFMQNEALFAFTKGKRGHALGLRFLGANREAEPEGAAPLPGKVNYLLGNDPAKWRTGVPSYGQILYRELWPGIDLAFSGNGRALKYELRLDPGADPGAVRLAYRGQERLSLGGSGDLRLKTALGVLRDSPPLSYQEIDGRRVSVETRFVLERSGAYGFQVGRYDRRRPLVIDPGLLYSTYLGGTNSDDRGFSIAVDSAGSAYVTGTTCSGTFPTTVGAFDTTANGCEDAFVTKLNATGSALLYSTYLGGSAQDVGQGIAVDGAGSAYVTGYTFSGNFPTTVGAFDTTANGGADVFVTKLNAAGSAPLLYSTYLGGSESINDVGRGIAVDSAGSAYVTGFTSSGSFPTTVGAYDTTYNGVAGIGVDAFVFKLNAAGSAPLLYSTYLGGGDNDEARGIAVDGTGSAYVTGYTYSGDFPTTAVAFDTTYTDNADAFVTKLNAAGSALLYSTYLGGSSGDFGHGIAVDGTGSAYVTGFTISDDFPTTVGAFDTTHNGSLLDAFVTKLNAAGSAPLYSTYLGGTSGEIGYGIAVDGAGSAYVTGYTDSGDFPTTVGAFDTTQNHIDAFVTKLNATGSAPLYSTYLGGSAQDFGQGIAVDNAGSAYVTGYTISDNFPTTAGAFDTTHNGSLDDAFVTKLGTADVPATLTLDPPADTNPVGTPHTVTATVEDASGNPVAGVTVRFSVTGANSASGSDVTDANGEATFTYTGTVAGLDNIFAFADTDGDGTQDAGEPSGTATKLWTPGPPATLTLTPPTATNVVGQTHCVTATVRDAFGSPVPGVWVRFSVPTAVATAASPSSGSATTNASGQATFCYSAALPGEDLIHAYADTDNDMTQDAGEPFGDATKTWTLPPSTELCEVKVTEGGWIIALNGDRANFGGNARVRDDGSVDGHENYQDHGPVDPRHVQSIEVTAVTCSDDLTTATIFGRATVDGQGDYVFRIDVIDQGEPGTNDSYGIILSDGYASGQQQLQGGNVQIHGS